MERYYKNKGQGLCTTCGSIKERSEILRCNSCQEERIKSGQRFRAAGKNKNPRAVQFRHEWRAKRYKELQEQVNRLKCSPCLDCKQTYNPWQMEFDHRDPVSKFKAIASLINRCCSEKKLYEELAKCDLLCSNCHKTRTHMRRQGKIYG